MDPTYEKGEGGKGERGQVKYRERSKRKGGYVGGKVRGREGRRVRGSEGARRGGKVRGMEGERKGYYRSEDERSGGQREK